MVATTLLVVVLRYAFGQGSIALQESVMYMHGLVFMLGIPFALKEDAHVRVDLLYARLSGRGRAWVDLIGHLSALLPVAAVVFFYSQDYVAAAWRIREGSPEVGGLPGIFLLKTLIPLTAVLLALQGLAGIARCVLVLRGRTGA
jgi:TRAP-type mannitol/chloroaromatic compound transport system permease small subunit